MNEIIDQFKDKKVIIWGDLILDEYIYTTTGRISREAPVLVTEFESNQFRLGGAGNVVMNIKSLGAVPYPVGLIGKDNDGRILKDILGRTRLKPIVWSKQNFIELQKKAESFPAETIPKNSRF